MGRTNQKRPNDSQLELLIHKIDYLFTAGNNFRMCATLMSVFDYVTIVRITLYYAWGTFAAWGSELRGR